MHFSVPYNENFNDTLAFDFFTLNDNGTRNKALGNAICQFGHANNAYDWPITPPIALDSSWHIRKLGLCQTPIQ